MGKAFRVTPDEVLARLPAGCRFSEIRWLAEAPSTNLVALEAAEVGAPEGLVVIADFQTAGRGRLDRRWEAPAGTALLLSALLRPVDLPSARRYLVVAATGLAAREACGQFGGPLPDLKWPNDLMVGDRKLAGILAEAVGDAVVVGVGCNVSSAPAGAAWLEEGGPDKKVDRAELAAGLLAGLDRRLGRWEEVADEYARTCSTLGRRVRIETAAGVVTGRAEAIDPEGALVVDGRAFSVGDVVHVRGPA
jgi:BirA family transcriptional regulator, biotin operon repressor / biotin---[acetyl-CoA-carboxylase] ligase